MKLRIEEVVSAVGGRFKKNQTPISGISTDSRTIRPGEVFIALRGRRYDGHNFIEDALNKRASYVVAEKESGNKTIIVNDTMRALGDLAGYYRRKFDVKVVAVTGSNGKTTTKDMIAAVLKTKFRVLKSHESYNNLVGVPLTIFALKKSHSFASLELGMSAPGEIKRLCEIVLPQTGVITNIGPAHLEYLISIERIADAKFELVNFLKEDDIVVVNGDDPIVLKKSKSARCKLFKFGIKNEADYVATDIKIISKMTSFFCNGVRFNIPLMGIQNVYNAIASIAVGDIYGIDSKTSKDALENFVPPKLRGEVKQRKGITIIDDSYNSNPASLRYALENLTTIGGSRKIAVLGDMLELGAKSREFHLKLGKDASHFANVLVAVGGEARYFKEKFDGEAFYFSTKKEALKFLQSFVKKGDTVLVKGSRAVGLEELSDALLAFIST